MNDLTATEQKAVRTALRFLRLRMGAWGPLAKALRYEWDSIQKVATGKRAVTPALALRVAPARGRGDGRTAGRPVAVASHLPALRPPAGRLSGRGHDRRVARAPADVLSGTARRDEARQDPNVDMRDLA
jgi:hypothetical protein